MRTVRLARGLFALAVLVTLLVGAPTALWLLSVRVLPSRVPTFDDITMALIRPDDGAVLLGVLTVVAWIVWVTLAVPVVGELRDRVRYGARADRRRERGTAWPSRVVATLLVGWVVGMFVSTSASAATPARVAVNELVPRASAGAPAPAAPARVHVVAARDTLWDIAAAELGDALRWREILDLNRGRVQPGGGRLTDDAVLQAGWTLVLPAVAGPTAGSIEVRPGDTLSELAERHLGAAARCRELYADNVGTRQPDGHSLADPDLIRPGWLLRLPAHAADDTTPDKAAPPDDAMANAPSAAPGPSSPAVQPRRVGGPQPSPNSAPQPSPAGRTSTTASSPTTAPSPSTAATVVPPPITSVPPTASAPTTSSPTSAPSAPSPATSREATALQETAHGSVTDPSVPDAPVLSAAGVLAASLLASLLLLRRRQQRQRRYGRRIALPGAQPSGVEAAVARTAQPAGPVFLDLVLRSVAAAEPAPFPPLQAVRLYGAGVDLLLATPQPPPDPFANADGSVWQVSHNTPLPLTEATAIGVANPYPALATLGHNDSGVLFLLDLEQVGAVHLTGDPGRAVNLLRHIAVELGTNRGADAVTVITVGLEPNLTSLPAHRVHDAPDLQGAIAHLHTAMRTAAEDLRRADGATLLDLRVRDQLSESWLVTVLLIAHTTPIDASELSTLCTELTESGRSAVAVVTAAFPTRYDGVTVEIADEGSASVSGFDDEQLHVEQMTAQLADDVVAILGTATDPDQPVGAAAAPELWALDMNEDGTWRRPAPPQAPGAESATSERAPEPLPRFRREAAPVESVGDPVAQPRLLLVDQQDAQLDDDLALPNIGTTTSQDAVADGAAAEGAHEPFSPLRREAAPVEPIGDPVAQRRLLLVEQQDGKLDDDLALWNAGTTPPRPLVAILGPPQLRAPGQPPEKRHSWYLEVIVYLALHPYGVDRDKLMTDLWPDGVAIQPPTIRRAVAEARAWAGKDTIVDPPTDFIPSISPAGGDRYRITGHLTDWDLFRRLRKRAQARVAAHRHTAAVADYTAALRLIRGPVLHPLRSRGYAWLHNPDQRHGDLIPGFVIDTAHELVDLALSTDDIDLARFAATTAQTVDPDRTSDRPFTDLMRIAHAAGDLDEMRTHAELLLAERDFEVGEELPPESFAVFNELFPQGLRARPA